MVVSGHDTIQHVPFESLIHPDLSVEVVERRDLIRRMGHRHMAIPKRLTFQAMMLVRSGTGTHTVDFEQVVLTAGRMVRILPGQVQAWEPGGDYEASLVISRLSPRRFASQFPWATESRDLDEDTFSTALSLVDLISKEQARFDGSDGSALILTSLFDAVCGLFDRSRPTSASPLPDAYVAYRTAIEKNLRHEHTVRGHTRALNYSERTVQRACLRATGLSARAVLVERLVLEAKRLLAHTDKSAATISAELGFSEPTNFHKFFKRHTRQRPTEFRALLGK